MIIKTKTNKIIGIPTSSKGENSFGVGKNHYHFLDQFGQVVFLAPGEETREDLDLLYLPGGADVNPIRYNQVPSIHTQNPDVYFEWFMTQRLQQYIDANIPIFGVCAGLQHLNVHFGGTLHQHLLNHPDSSDRWETAHRVWYLDGKTTKGKSFKVNSHHHQGIDQLGAGLIPTLVFAWSNPFYKVEEDEDGKETKKGEPYETPQYQLIEAFRHETLPIVAVQYHPEELYDNYSINRIIDLLKIAK